MRRWASPEPQEPLWQKKHWKGRKGHGWNGHHHHQHHAMASQAGMGADPSAGAAGGDPSAMGAGADPSAGAAPPMRRWAQPEPEANYDDYSHLYARDAAAEAWADEDMGLYERDAEPDWDALYERDLYEQGLYEREAEPEPDFDNYGLEGLYERDAEPDYDDLYERDAEPEAEFEERDVDDLYSFMY